MRWWAHLSPDVVHEEDEYGDDDRPDILRYQLRDHSKKNAKPRVGWKRKENRVNILKPIKCSKAQIYLSEFLRLQKYRKAEIQKSYVGNSLQTHPKQPLFLKFFD